MIGWFELFVKPLQNYKNWYRCALPRMLHDSQRIADGIDRRAKLILDYAMVLHFCTSTEKTCSIFFNSMLGHALR